MRVIVEGCAEPDESCVYKLHRTQEDGMRRKLNPHRAVCGGGGGGGWVVGAGMYRAMR